MDVFISTLFIVISAVFFALTFDLADPRAALYPRILLVGLLIFSVWYFVSSVRDRHRPGPVQSIDDLDSAHFLGIIGLSLLYILGMIFFGYFAATTVFIAFGIYLLGYRRLKIMVAVSLGVTLFVFVIFKTLMYASLPQSKLDNWLTEFIYTFLIN